MKKSNPRACTPDGAVQKSLFPSQMISVDMIKWLSPFLPYCAYLQLRAMRHAALLSSMLPDPSL